MKQITTILLLISIILVPVCAYASSEAILEQLILEERQRREAPGNTVSEEIRRPTEGRLDPVHASEKAAGFTDRLLRQAQAWALPCMIITWFVGLIIWAAGAFSGASKNGGPALMLIGTSAYVIIQAAPIMVGVFLRWLENLQFM